MLGTALDAVVRSSRMPIASQVKVAERFLDLWRASGEPWLVVDSTNLTVDGQLALTYATEEGVWLLPAFMAGLHAFRPKANAHPEEVRRFAEELGDLHPDLHSISKLRDWLWSEGAEGFELNLASSFIEADDADLAESIVQRQRAGAIRSDALSAFEASAVGIGSRELDAAAIREEFQAPLDVFLDAAGGGGLTDDDGEVAALGGQIEDGTRWAAAQIEAVLARPELRGVMPAARLARQILALLAERADPRVLDYVNRLAERNDPYAQALSQALDGAELGQSVAARIEATASSGAVTARFLAAAPPRVARGLAQGLLDRAQRSPEAGQWVTGVVLQFGLPAFLALLDLAALSERGTRALAGIIASGQGTSEVLRGMIREVPGPRAALLLQGLPDAHFWRLQDELERIISTEPGEVVAPLLQRMIESERQDAARVLGASLLSRVGEGWSARSLPPTCEFIARLGLAREFLVPIARNTRLEPRLRLVALRYVTDPDDLRAASAWRLGELLDPPDVRERFKEIRDHLKRSAAKEREAR